MVQDVAMMSCIHRGEVVVASGKPTSLFRYPSNGMVADRALRSGAPWHTPAKAATIAIDAFMFEGMWKRSNNKKNINIYDKAPRHEFCHAYLLGCVCTDGYIWRWCMPLKPLKRWGEAEPDI